MFFTGKLKLSEEFQKIIDSLVNKDGIVPEDKKDGFRSKLRAWKLSDEVGGAIMRRRTMMQGVLAETKPGLAQALEKQRSLVVDESDQEEKPIPLVQYEESKGNNFTRQQRETIMEQQDILDEIQGIILTHYKDGVEKGKNGKFTENTAKIVMRDALKIKLLESN